MTSFVDEYQRWDALDLARLIASGEVTAREVLEAAIARVSEVNGAINAVVHPRFEDARADRNAQSPAGLLGGVPFLLKDITIHVRDWPISSGSRFLKDYVSTFTSEIVERYRAAGLILFGRTTSPEFGYAASTESRLFGVTRNPWDLSLSSGGSSGGASAAVAAGIVPMAQGGDSGGSLRIPAAFCGLFGFKPTRAVTPGGPHHGSFLGFSCIHAISRSVRDSAALLDATAGPDLGAPYFTVPPAESYSANLSAPLRRLRIALQTTPFNDVPLDAECERAAIDVARLCESLGHVVEPVTFSVDSERLQILYNVVWPAMILRAVQQQERATGRVSTDDFELHVVRLLDQARRLTAADFVEGLETMHSVGREFAQQFDGYDMMLTPTTALETPPIGMLDPSNPDQAALDHNLARAVAFTQIFNVTGQPAASVPVYWSEAGLPVGVQIAARYGDDAGLLQLAAQLEAARPWAHRRPHIATA